MANTKNAKKKNTKQINELTAAVISLAVIAALLLAGIGAGIGLQWDATRALFRGESVYTQADVNAAADSGKENGYQNGFQAGKDEGYLNGVTEGMESGYNNGFAEAMQYDFIRVGDDIDGFYYNTDINPREIFESLDWTKAHLIINAETSPEVFDPSIEGSIAGMGILESSMMYLVCGFVPPSEPMNNAEYLQFWEDNNLCSEDLQLQVRRTLKENGETQYLLAQHGSHGIGVWGTTLNPGGAGEMREGWAYDITEFDSLDRTGAVEARFVNENQTSWYKVVGKRCFASFSPTALTDGETIDALYVNPSSNAVKALEKIHEGRLKDEPIELFGLINEVEYIEYSFSVWPLIGSGATPLNSYETITSNDYCLAMTVNKNEIRILYSTISFSAPIEGGTINGYEGWQNLDNAGILISPRGSLKVCGDVYLMADEGNRLIPAELLDAIFSKTPFKAYKK